MSTPDLPMDAYQLLSKPTLKLTDEEVTVICADLRKRRERFLAGIKDNQPKVKKAPAAPMSDEAKQAAQDDILNDIGKMF